MANIKTRILQILGQKNALQLDQLIESVRDIALIQDKIKLDETRIKIIINQLLKAGIILEFEGKLMINNPTNMSRVHSNQGINITYYPTGQSCTMGSPGMTIGNTTMTFGNPAIIRQNPACYFFTIDIDLPLKLELKEYKHQLLSCKIENINYRICHIVKKRGEECFSIFDTKYLPYFSFIQNPR